MHTKDKPSAAGTRPPELKKKKTWFAVALILFFTFVIPIIPIVLFFITYVFLFRPFQMNGSGMEPTYVDDQYLGVNLLFNNFTNPSRGEVIVFVMPGDISKDTIKRVIGIPGDTIQLKNNKVWVNDTVLDEKRITKAGAFLTENEIITVPENTYFVLGDNRSDSIDSRDFGFVPRKDIIGVASPCLYNCNPVTNPEPIMKGYTITIPSNYVLDPESTETDMTYRTPTMNPEKVITIHSETSQLYDPCEQIPLGYPNAKCSTFQELPMLDLGTHIPPLPSGPTQYNYLLTDNGTLYHITFVNLTEDEKTEILNTFTFTDE